MTRHAFLLISIICFCFSLSPSVSSAKGNRDPATLIQKVIESSKTIPYEGILSYRKCSYDPHKEWIAKVKIFRPSETEKRLEIIDMTIMRPSKPEGKMETVPLQRLKGIVLLHTQDNLWGTHLEKEELDKLRKEMGSFSLFRLFWEGDRIPLEHQDLLKKNYKISIDRSKPVAKRKTLRIDFRPKQDNRPSMKVWIDSETKILLKYERYSYKEKILETYAFRQIELGKTIESRTMNPEGLHKIYSTKHQDKKEEDPPLDFTPFVTTWLPEGFEKVSESRIRKDRLGIHTKYTDGFAHLSIFQRRQTPEEKKKQEEREKLEAQEQKDQKDQKRKRKVKKYNFYGRDFLVWETRGLRLSGIGDINHRAIARTVAHLRFPETVKSATSTQ